MAEIVVRTEDGWTLRGAHQGGRGRAVVVCGHAMMVSARTFERGRVPELLAARGFEVYNFDLRGHGRSRGGGRDWTYDVIVFRDLPAMVAGARARHPGLPVAVVGHSLIGHAALAWLGQEPEAPVDAVAGIAANVWIAALEPSRIRWWEKRALLEAWLAAARLAGRFPARRLHIGTEDVPLPYVRQFASWGRNGRWQSLDGRDYLAGLVRVRTPGAPRRRRLRLDPCAPASGRAFAERLTGAPVTFWEVAPGEIDGLVPDHMRLVTDPRAAPLWERVAHWLDRALPPSPVR